MIDLYPDEVNVARTDPSILEQIAAWHKVRAVLLRERGIYRSAEYHESRERKLLDEAEHIKKERSKTYGTK